MTAPTPIRPSRAMVLAAGIGKRMRPLTATVPKPLIEVGGRALIDYAFDRLDHAGVQKVVVNIHYLPDLMAAHLRRRTNPEIVVSDERSGSSTPAAAPPGRCRIFGDAPFYLLNSDTFWIEGARPNLDWLAGAWRDEDMDALILVAPTVSAIGYAGRGDFRMDPAGRLLRRTEREVVPFVYAGAAILHPRLFKGAPEGRFSMNHLFDKAIEAERFFGVRMDGLWFHVGTPQAIGEAERTIADSAA